MAGVFKQAYFSAGVGKLPGDLFYIFDVVHHFIEIILLNLFLHRLALILLLVFLLQFLLIFDVVVVVNFFGDQWHWLSALKLLGGGGLWCLCLRWFFLNLVGFYEIVTVFYLWGEYLDGYVLLLAYLFVLPRLRYFLLLHFGGLDLWSYRDVLPWALL